MLSSLSIRTYDFTRLASVIYEIAPATNAADLLQRDYRFMRAKALNEIKAQYANMYVQRILSKSAS